MPFCSTVIASIGRPTLSRAVESVLHQDFPHGEHTIVVVNDSGRPLPAAPWQLSNKVTVITTQNRERSIARNVGAAISRGRYLHFLDDDDWLLPGALQAFWDLSLESDCAWLYGGTQLVSREGKPLIPLYHGLHGNVFLPAMAGEWIPLQASLIRQDAFFGVGGFNPALAGSEDIDLLRRIALTYDLAEAPTLVAAVAMGRKGSTTDYSHHACESRGARELILNSPNAGRRLAISAHEASQRGRNARIYLTSCLWNLKRGCLLTACSRGARGIGALASSGRSLFQPALWRSLGHSYQSQTFARGFQEVAAASSQGS